MIEQATEDQVGPQNQQLIFVSWCKQGNDSSRGIPKSRTATSHLASVPAAPAMLHSSSRLKCLHAFCLMMLQCVGSPAFEAALTCLAVTQNSSFCHACLVHEASGWVGFTGSLASWCHCVPLTHVSYQSIVPGSNLWFWGLQKEVGFRVFSGI